jgi:hypothetical protein
MTVLPNGRWAFSNSLLRNKDRPSNQGIIIYLGDGFFEL